MMTQAQENSIDGLHRTYCLATGYQLPCSMERRAVWREWLNAIKDMDCKPDLAINLVAAKVRADIKAGRRWRGALRFSLLIADTERFTEELAAVLAELRKPRMPAGKAEVLRATGRSTEIAQPDAKTVAQVMQEHEKMAALLKDYRERGFEA